MWIVYGILICVVGIVGLCLGFFLSHVSPSYEKRKEKYWEEQKQRLDERLRKYYHETHEEISTRLSLYTAEKRLENEKALAALQQQKHKSEQELGCLVTKIDSFQDEISRLRRQYDQDIKDYEKQRIATKKHILQQYKVERERELSRLIQEYDELEKTTKDAIDLIKLRMDEWSSIERSAYEERESRENAEKRNRLVLSERSIGELKELYEACGKLKLANPQPLYKAIYELYLRGPVKDLGVRVASGGICGIYKITNVLNGYVYVGQSVDIAERWKQHIKRGCRCDVGTLSGAGLYEAMWENGVWNFSFQVLEECPKDQLNAHEKIWIEHFQSNEIGYNKRT